MYKYMYGVIRKMSVNTGRNFCVAVLELRTRTQSFRARLRLLSVSCNSAYLLHQLSIIMTADRELADGISEEEFVGFSREELVGFSKKELGIHPFGFGG